MDNEELDFVQPHKKTPVTLNIAPKTYSIGETVHKIRMSQDIPTYYIANKVGCSVEMLIRIEKGTYIPSFNLFSSICYVCNVDMVEYLNTVTSLDIMKMVTKSDAENEVFKKLWCLVKGV